MEKEHLDRYNAQLRDPESNIHRTVMYGARIRDRKGRVIKTVPGIYQLTVKVHFHSKGRRLN